MTYSLQRRPLHPVQLETRWVLRQEKAQSPEETILEQYQTPLLRRLSQ